MRLFDVMSAGTSYGSLTLENLTLERGYALGGSGGSSGLGGAGGGAAAMGGAIFVNPGEALSIRASTLTGNIAHGGNGGGQLYVTTPAGVQGAGGGGVSAGGESAVVGSSYIDGGAPAGGQGYSDKPGGNGGPGGGGGGGGALAGSGGRYGEAGGNGGWGGGGGGGGAGGNNSGAYGGGGNGGNGGWGGGGGGGGYQGHSNGRYGYAGYGGGKGGGADDSGGGTGGGGAGMGGAVYNDGGTVTITDSTFANNDAIGGQPGNPDGKAVPVGSNGAGLGGAVFNDNGSVSVVYSTLAANFASKGGAIFNIGDGAVATVILADSILASTANGNTDFWGTTIAGTNGTSKTIAMGNNLIQNNEGFVSISGALPYVLLTNVNPLLGPLENNGGPTLTMAPLVGSPAIGEGDGSASLGVTTDQRGEPRVYDLPSVANAANGDGSGLGAVELQPATYTVTTTVDDTSADSNLSLREAVELADGTLSLGALTAAQRGDVVGDPGAGGTIGFASSLAGQTMTLSVTGDSTLGPTALLITSDVSIVGPAGNQGITIAGPGSAETLRLFRVAGGADPDAGEPHLERRLRGRQRGGQFVRRRRRWRRLGRAGRGDPESRYARDPGQYAHRQHGAGGRRRLQLPGRDRRWRRGGWGPPGTELHRAFLPRYRRRPSHRRLGG